MNVLSIHLIILIQKIVKEYTKWIHLISYTQDNSSGRNQCFPTVRLVMLNIVILSRIRDFEAENEKFINFFSLSQT